ncbi:hypothetical protein SDC9_86968 [bioreactor metagenome]|uniref:Uncharacterized protein n=1 Tax=bioreactor metagenome TaxID=1076179 RepID=A0A644ZJ18_9ZZZZ
MLNKSKSKSNLKLLKLKESILKASIIALKNSTTPSKINQIVVLNSFAKINIFPLIGNVKVKNLLSSLNSLIKEVPR